MNRRMLVALTGAAAGALAVAASALAAPIVGTRSRAHAPKLELIAAGSYTANPGDTVRVAVKLVNRGRIDRTPIRVTATARAPVSPTRQTITIRRIYAHSQRTLVFKVKISDTARVDVDELIVTSPGLGSWITELDVESGATSTCVPIPPASRC